MLNLSVKVWIFHLIILPFMLAGVTSMFTSHSTIITLTVVMGSLISLMFTDNHYVQANRGTRTNWTWLR